MDARGAAILDFGHEFGGNSTWRTMHNDGPNLRANDVPNRVTPYVDVSPSDPVGDDTISHLPARGMSIHDRSGYRPATKYGLDGNV